MPSALSFGEPARPFTSLISGLGAGRDYEERGADLALKRQKQEIGQIAIEQTKGQQAALASGDMNELMKYNPELVMKMDEARAKKMEEGIGLVYKAAPFLLERAGDPRVWSEFAKDLKPYGVPDAVTSMLTTGSPVDRIKALTNIMKTADNMKVDLSKRLTEVETEAKTKLMKAEVETKLKPMLQLEEGMRSRLAAEHDTRTLNYQKMTDKRQRELAITNDFSRENNALSTSYSKTLSKMEESMIGMPEIEKAEVRARAENTFKQARNRLIDDFTATAKEFGVPFVRTKEEITPVKSKTGPPPGTDPAFDNARAKIEAMKPGPAKEAKIKQLIERWQSLQEK